MKHQHELTPTRRWEWVVAVIEQEALLAWEVFEEFRSEDADQEPTRSRAGVASRYWN